MENESLARRLLKQLNRCPLLPEDLAGGGVLYGLPGIEAPGLTLLAEGGERVRTWDIAGGREEALPFALIYRVRPDVSVDRRLGAEEKLEALAEWMAANPPALAEGEREMALTAEWAVPGERLEGGLEEFRMRLELRRRLAPGGAESE